MIAYDVRKPNSGWVRFVYCLLSIVFALLFACPSASAESTHRLPPAERPIDSAGNMHIAPTDRCPVCGMKVAKYPRFAAAIQLKDRTTYYFCSNRCMLRTWLKPDVFLAIAPTELAIPVIQEYFSGQHLDARQVIWVSGSDVIGPMGPALVPLQDDASLSAFRQRHGSKIIFRLTDLDARARNAIERKPSDP
jgi:nitrous oxide reductase accessory protein NosL